MMGISLFGAHTGFLQLFVQLWFMYAQCILVGGRGRSSWIEERGQVLFGFNSIVVWGQSRFLYLEMSKQLV